MGEEKVVWGSNDQVNWSPLGARAANNGLSCTQMESPVIIGYADGYGQIRISFTRSGEFAVCHFEPNLITGDMVINKMRTKKYPTSKQAWEAVGVELGWWTDRELIAERDLQNPYGGPYCTKHEDRPCPIHGDQSCKHPDDAIRAGIHDLPGTPPPSWLTSEILNREG